MMPAVIGEKAPNLRLSEWVQGIPTNFDQEKDHIVIVEVFQVNCPGCFLYGIPEAISVYEKYSSEGVRVIGVATAFEDYDKNTLGNLKMLAETGEVVGDTKRGLGDYGKLNGDKLGYKIPFPLAMDEVTERNERYPNMKLFGSYFIYKDGMHYWFEVILADPSHPSVSKDKELRARVLSGVA